eukprot:TRINITY_DN38158_c0_g1_i1.p1 TRINITY_DN38158_c0_g1~~TRINITY_DN38158_c0_g1_i1.p1  ORF type:complete len:938 (+),score=145.21 TRINITY_DN38158_c0_g1_i1:55-2814(+)
MATFTAVQSSVVTGNGETTSRQTCADRAVGSPVSKAPLSDLLSDQRELGREIRMLQRSRDSTSDEEDTAPSLRLDGPAVMRRRRSAPSAVGRPPLALDTASSSNRRSLHQMMPTIGARVMSTAGGVAVCGVGFAMGQLQCAAGHTEGLADSSNLLTGCWAVLRSQGILPTVLVEANDCDVEPMPSDPAQEHDLVRGTSLIVANHVSYLDGLILPVLLRFPRVLAKTDVRHYALIGQLAKQLDCIWVKRNCRRSRMQALRAIWEHATTWKKGGRSLLLFPEGTTSNGTSLLPFKKGAFAPGVTVRPVLVKYTGAWDPANTNFIRLEDAEDRTLDSASDGGNASSSEGRRLAPYGDKDWFLQFFGHLGHTCVVLVCRPYCPSPEEVENPELFASNVRRVMRRRLRELHTTFADGHENSTVADMANRLSAVRRRTWQRRATNLLRSPPPPPTCFDRRRVGRHVQVSASGLRVRHNAHGRGLGGVAFVDGPVPRLGGAGAYFEVLVEETMKGRGAGLVLGLTTMLPEVWETFPEFAVDVPHSWSIGYEGLACVHGQDTMFPVPWRPSQLHSGDRAGLLVTRRREVWVLVNDSPVCRMPGFISVGGPLYAFVDLCDCTVAVSLLPDATPAAKSLYMPVPVPHQRTIGNRAVTVAMDVDARCSFASGAGASGTAGNADGGTGDATSACASSAAFSSVTAVEMQSLGGFNRVLVGRHVYVSPNGLVARHLLPASEELGGVIFGDAPLPRFDVGAYFEVSIVATRRGQVDGIAIGVTTQLPPASAIPFDCADLVPRSWSVGFDGHAHVDGEAGLVPIDWKPRRLLVGDRVGVLVTASGGFRLFVNGETKVRIASASLAASVVGANKDVPLFAVVDLLGNTTAVSLVVGALPPTAMDLRETDEEVIVGHSRKAAETNVDEASKPRPAA